MIHYRGFNGQACQVACTVPRNETRQDLPCVLFDFSFRPVFRCPLSTAYESVKRLTNPGGTKDSRPKDSLQQECIPLIFLHSLSNCGCSARSPIARSKKPISISSHHVYSRKMQQLINRIVIYYSGGYSTVCYLDYIRLSKILYTYIFKNLRIVRTNNVKITYIKQ